LSLDQSKYENVNLKQNLGKLWGFSKKYKFVLFATIAIMFFNELITLGDTFVYKYLVDKGTLFVQNEITLELFTKLIFISIGIYFAIRMISAFLWYFAIRFNNIFQSKIMNDIENKSFWHIINLSYRYHINKKTGSIISQFTRGVSKVENFLDAFIFNFVNVFFRVSLSIGVIFYFDFRTSLTLLGMIIVFVFAGIYITNKQKKPQGIANYREDLLKQNLSDVFLNIETVKYFGKEKRTHSYFSSLSQNLREARFKFWQYFSWFSLVETIILAVGMTLMFYFSFTSLAAGNLTIGSVTLIFTAIWRLLPWLFGLMHGYRQFVRSSVDVDALFKMFDEENEVKDIENAKPIKVDKGDIKFKEVSFVYPSKDKRSKREVIKNVSYHFKPNSKVALVGPSGSGKTTLVKLLYRLFDLQDGKITIDGQNINSVTQKSLRNNMSIVPQEPILFDNTLWFNIAYANPRASKDKIWKAIKFAQLDKFVANLPRKEKTIVGERGVKLSGGEKQRVSIARAILADKKILVLDEATSALDSETEREIQKDLEKLMKGRTTIMIAHRLSTIMKADEIIVMNNGKILEIGKHRELKNKKGGLYQKLWSLQQGGEL
jgi:ATP-binding cassette, subfamily B, heavy metal transporter